MSASQDDIETNSSLFSPSLHIQRKMFISEALKQERHRVLCEKGLQDVDVFDCFSRILDVGCGSGNLLQYLRMDGYRILDGVDKCKASLKMAQRFCQPSMLHYFSSSTCHPQLIISLYNSDVCALINTMDQDGKDMRGCYDATICTEVIEHVWEDTELVLLEKFLFSYVASPVIIVTTPNHEFNAIFHPDQVVKSQDYPMRHKDHKFEWNRSQFSEWCDRMSKTYGYEVFITGVGSINDGNVDYKELYGWATQICIFRCSASTEFTNSSYSSEIMNLVTEICYPDYTQGQQNTTILDECIYAYCNLVRYLKDEPYIAVQDLFNMLDRKWVSSVEELAQIMINEMTNVFIVDTDYRVQMIEADDTSIEEQQPHEFLSLQYCNDEVDNYSDNEDDGW